MIVRHFLQRSPPSCGTLHLVQLGANGAVEAVDPLVVRGVDQPFIGAQVDAFAVQDAIGLDVVFDRDDRDMAAKQQASSKHPGAVRRQLPAEGIARAFDRLRYVVRGERLAAPGGDRSVLNFLDGRRRGGAAARQQERRRDGGDADE